MFRTGWSSGPLHFSPAKRICGLVVALTVLAAGFPATAVTSSKPQISQFTSDVTSLDYLGGSITLRGSVLGAATCTLSASPARSGLPVTVQCSTATLSHSITLPRNATSRPVVHKFTLVAQSSSGRVSATTSVTVAATPAPTISNAQVGGTPFSAAGAMAILTADVTLGTTCRIGVSPTLSGFPAAVPCSPLSKLVTFPANTTRSAKSYKFTITAAGDGGSASTTVTAVVEAPPLPSISSLSTSASMLAARGGPVTVTWATQGAATCKLSTTPTVRGIPSTLPCGNSSQSVTFPALASGVSSAQYTLTLSATNVSGTVIATATVVVSSSPPLFPVFEVTPTAVDSSGGAVVVSANGLLVDKCAVSISPQVSPAVVFSPCSTLSNTFRLPENSSGRNAVYTVTISATGPGGRTEVQRSVTVQAAPAIAAHFDVTVAYPDFRVPASGGVVHLRGDALYAANCDLTVNPPVSDTPISVDCSGFALPLTIPENLSGEPMVFELVFTARSDGGDAVTRRLVRVAAVPPSVDRFLVDSTALPATGGSITLSGSARRTSACEISATPAVAGFPVAVPCTDFVLTAEVPANATRADIRYTFTLMAHGPEESIEQDLTVLALALPAVSGFDSRARTLGASGGSVGVTYTFTGAQSCTVSSSPTVIETREVPCRTTNSTPVALTFPANNSSVSEVYEVYLTAVGPGGISTVTFLVTVQAKEPAVVGFESDLHVLTSAGGSIALSGSALRATRCEIHVSPAIAGIPESVACADLAAELRIPANDTSLVVTYAITVTATGSGGDASAQIEVHVAPTPETQVLQIVQGSLHRCVLLASGRLACWGMNDFGQLGYGVGGDSSSPRIVAGLDDVVQVAAGGSTTCAVRRDGSVWCWGADYRQYDPFGYSSSGQIRNYRPQQILPPGSATSVAVGVQHVCAVTPQAGVRCWGIVGSDGFGGTGAPVRGSSPHLAPLSGVLSLYIRGLITCAFKDDDSIVCSGTYNATLIAMAQAAQAPQSQPVGLPPVSSIVKAEVPGCAVLMNGEVVCWGDNSTGLLGDGTKVDDLRGAVVVLPNPPAPPVIHRFVADSNTLTAAGGSVRFSFDASGAISCSMSRALTTTDIETNAQVVASSVDCSNGNLDVPIPAQFTNNAITYTFILYANGAAETVIAMTTVVVLARSPEISFEANLTRLPYTGGTVTLTGSARYATSCNVSTVVVIGNFYLPSKQDVDCAGFEFTTSVDRNYGVTPVGNVWTLNAFIGTVRTSRSIVVYVDPEPPSVSLQTDTESLPASGGAVVLTGTSSRALNCALSSSPDLGLQADVSCSGFSLQVDLPSNGTPTPVTYVFTLTAHGSVESIVSTVSVTVAATLIEPPGARMSVSVGWFHSCVVTVGGALQCWGSNVPSIPEDLGAVKAVSAGGNYYTCALLVSGFVRCWGDNSYGQTSVPDDLGPALSISAGYYHACAITVNHIARCWGANTYGQASVPSYVSDAVSIGAGYQHTCAVSTAGYVTCWGANNKSQLYMPDQPGVVTALAVGAYHQCVITATGSVMCWGRNNYGQIVVPADLGPVLSLSVGFLHTCALTVERKVRCWGIASSNPVPTDLPAVSSISSGFSGTCAVTVEGAIICWGSNSYGELSVPPALLVPPNTHRDELLRHQSFAAPREIGRVERLPSFFEQ